MKIVEGNRTIHRRGEKLAEAPSLSAWARKETRIMQKARPLNEDPLAPKTINFYSKAVASALN